MVRMVIALVLVAHGIGHSMGIFQVLKVAAVNPGWDGRSWVLSDVAGSAVTNAVAIVLWAVALAGFVVLGGVVMGWLPEGWFAPLAIGASLVSIAGIALFPSAFPIFSTLGALAVDVAVLVAVLWYHWTPDDLTA